MKRIEYIDISKGIGILMVIIGHIAPSGTFRNIIYTFHIPLFFLIAGYTFHYESFYDNTILLLKRKSLRLLFPYFFFTLSFTVYLTYVNGLVKISFFEKLFGILMGNGNDLWTYDITALWFLVSLFCAEITFYFFIKITHKKSAIEQILVLISIVIIGYLLGKKKLFIPWGFDVALIAQIFMFIGWNINQHNIIDTIKEQSRTKKILILINLFVILGVAIYFNERVDMNGRLYKDLFLFYTGGVSGSLIVLIVSSIIKNENVVGKILSVLGINSLIILCVHFYAIRLYYNELLRYVPTGFKVFVRTQNVPSKIIGVIWVTFFSILVCYIMKKLPIINNLFYPKKSKANIS